MFCPNCSQKQVSDQIKFCKSCGFPLEDVTEIIKNEGYVERNEIEYIDLVEYTRDLKRAVTKGVIIITLSIIYFILSLILGIPEPSYAVQLNLLVGVLMFLTGLILIGNSFFKRISIDSEQKDHQNTARHHPPPIFDSPTTPFMLYEQDQSEFIEAKPLNTNRLRSEQSVGQPPSVAEGTTKLLRKEEK